jgi:hypothetical protein
VYNEVMKEYSGKCIRHAAFVKDIEAKVEALKLERRNIRCLLGILVQTALFCESPTTLQIHTQILCTELLLIEKKMLTCSYSLLKYRRAESDYARFVKSTTVWKSTIS